MPTIPVTSSASLDRQVAAYLALGFTLEKSKPGVAALLAHKDGDRVLIRVGV